MRTFLETFQDTSQTVDEVMKIPWRTFLTIQILLTPINSTPKTGYDDGKRTWYTWIWAKYNKPRPRSPQTVVKSTGNPPPMPETIQVFFSGIFVENLPWMFDGLLLSMIFLFSPQVAEIEKSSSRWAPPVAPAQVTSPMRRWIDLLGWKT